MLQSLPQFSPENLPQDIKQAQWQVVAKIQGDFIENQHEGVAFDAILEHSCALTCSEFGFIAEARNNADGVPYLRVNSLRGPDKADLPHLTEMQHLPLEGSIDGLSHIFTSPFNLTEAQIHSVATHPCNSPPSSSLAVVYSWMTIPVLLAGDVVGLIGLANRGGYTHELATQLQPLAQCYAQLILALRSKRDYRQANEALLQRDQLWKTAIEGVGHGVWDWNVQQNKLIFTETWANILGHHLDEISDDPREWSERIHPEDRKATQALLNAHLNRDSPVFATEHRLRCKDGSYKWLLDRGLVVLRDEHGKPVRMIGTNTDISQRKAAEDALLANRAQLAGMIDSAMDAIITTDSDFNIILFNRAAEQMFGHPAYKMLGCPIEVLIPAQSALTHRALMHQFAGQGDGTRKMLGGAGRHVNGLRANGNEFPLEVSISFSDNYGNPIYTAMVRDITDRQEYEENMLALTTTLEERVRARTQELETARLQAESANKAKSAFVANMSHEIRTPLNSVLGMAHLALKTDLNQQQRDYLNKISNSGQHLLGLINDILDFSKIEAGKMALDCSDFSLRELLNDLKDLIEPRAQEKNLQLELCIAPEMVNAVHGDALRLKQVLLNLLSNAVKFTEHGRVQLMLSPAQNDPARTCFTVRDTGIGITPEAQARLFQSFQQADNSTTRKYGGTGLGLVISRELVHLMGGELLLQSQPKRGSEFSFCIPLAAAQCAAPELAVLKQSNTDYLTALAGKHVLLADDHPFNQQVGMELLAEVGVTVTIANNGREAVDLATQHHFDAILMDVQMPEMDGFTACQVLRSQPRFESLPIIAMTANVSSEDRQHCLDAGMNDFIGKPVEPEKMYRVLGYWLVDQSKYDSDDDTHDESSPDSLIDWTSLETMLGNQPERQRKYLAKFVTSVRAGLALIRQLQHDNAQQKISAECHRLKSIARTVGAACLGNALAELEAQVEMAVTPSQIEALDGLFYDTCRYLQQNGLLEDDVAPSAIDTRTPQLNPALRIMLIDDDDFALQLVSQYLVDLQLTHITCCLDANTALVRLEQGESPDWILCDLQMPDMDGITFLRLLGQKNYRGQVGILSGMDRSVLKATERLGQSFRLNIHGALSKPSNKNELLQLLTSASLKG